MRRRPGEVAVITAAAASLGPESAGLFAREDACVTGAGIDSPAAQSAADDGRAARGAAVFHRTNVENPASAAPWEGRPPGGATARTSCSIRSASG